jgi:hypothetical protein
VYGLDMGMLDVWVKRCATQLASGLPPANMLYNFVRIAGNATYEHCCTTCSLSGVWPLLHPPFSSSVQCHVTFTTLVTHQHHVINLTCFNNTC